MKGELKKAAGRLNVWSFVCWLIVLGCAWWWGIAKGFVVLLVLTIAGFALLAMVRGIRSGLARGRVRVGEPVVSIPVSALPLGGNFVATYQQRWKRAVDVQRIIMQLVLRETVRYTTQTDSYAMTVRYTSGSATRIDRHDKVVQRLETQGRRFERGEVLDGEYAFRVPWDGMHTFAPSLDNRIEWYVTLDIELARWPDMHREYEITVLPQFGE